MTINKKIFLLSPNKLYTFLFSFFLSSKYKVFEYILALKVLAPILIHKADIYPLFPLEKEFIIFIP